MKKMLVFLSIFGAFVIGVICGIFYTKNMHKDFGLPDEVHEEVKNGTLYINGTKITDENVTIHKRNDFSSYVDLPFIEVLKEMGFNIVWHDKNIADIFYENKQYVLNMPKAELFMLNDDENLIEPIPGAVQTYKILNKELVLDDITMRYLLSNIGKEVYFNFDTDKSTVYMTYKK